MKIDFLTTEDTVTFQVTDYSSSIEDALRLCYYEKAGDAYVKRFPVDTPYLDKIKAHYALYAEEMFLQIVYLRPIPWEQGLLTFADRVAGTGVDWWLTGSCAACVRGIPLKPHDVDIMVDARNIGLLRELFQDDTIEPIVDSSGWVTKDFGVLFLGCRVDIASDPQPILDQPEPVDCGPYAKTVLETVSWRGHQLRIPPIELQLNANRRRQRVERVRLIEEYMQARNS